MRKTLLIFLLVLVQFAASAQNLSEQKERRQKAEKEIEFINSQLKTISSKKKASTEQLSLIQKKLMTRKALLKETDDRIKGIEAKIAVKNREISRLNAELDTLKSYYSNLVYSTYRNRDTRVWFMYVLASQDIGQGYRRFSYFKDLAQQVGVQKTSISEKQAVLECQMDTLADMKREAVRMRDERKKEYNQLTSEENQYRKTVKSLSKTQEQYRKELANKKKEVERLNREIEKMVSSTIKSQKSSKKEVDYALSGSFEQNKGRLPWPVKQGVIIERFGVHSHPVYKNLKMPQSNGVTFRTGKNANVFCVFDGVVSNIAVIPGYSQCVLVQHGTYFTFYCKLSAVNVKSGQKVKAGDCLGTLDADDSNGSSLHFQIWKGTEKHNPEKWLRK